MFLRFSLIFVLMLCFEFGALKSIANIANSDVSDNGLSNIKNLMKYPGINSKKFPSNESNINADDQIHLTEDDMFSRILNAVLWFANQSIYSLGGQAQTIKQSFHLTLNQNPIINNYPPVSQPLERHTTKAIIPSTIRVQLQPGGDDGSSKVFHRSNNVHGLPGVQPTIASM